MGAPGKRIFVPTHHGGDTTLAPAPRHPGFLHMRCGGKHSQGRLRWPLRILAHMALLLARQGPHGAQPAPVCRAARWRWRADGGCLYSATRHPLTPPACLLLLLPPCVAGMLQAPRTAGEHGCCCGLMYAITAVGMRRKVSGLSMQAGRHAHPYHGMTRRACTSADGPLWVGRPPSLVRRQATLLRAGRCGSCV